MKREFYSTYSALHDINSLLKELYGTHTATFYKYWNGAYMYFYIGKVQYKIDFHIVKDEEMK